MAYSARTPPPLGLRIVLLNPPPPYTLYISSPTTSIIASMVLISFIDPPSPLTPSSSELRSPGGSGTFTIPLTVSASSTLDVLLGSDEILSSAPSHPLSASPYGSGMCLSCLLCAPAWVALSMPASRTAQSWRLPQALFA